MAESTPVAAVSDAPPTPRPRNRARSGGGIWFPALVVGIGIHAAAFFALGVSPGHRELKRPEPRGFKWVGERADELIAIRDPKPIFLPTRWNAAAREVSEVELRGAGEIFGDEKRTPLVERGSIPAALVAPRAPNPTASDATQRFSRRYFSAFGQRDMPVRRVPERAAGLEVRRATTGEVMLRWQLSVADVSAIGGTDPKQWPFWAPFELLIVVDPVGMVGLPLVATPGSGAEVVDEFFRTNLRTLLKPNAVLPAGYYRVVIGP